MAGRSKDPRVRAAKLAAAHSTKEVSIHPYMYLLRVLAGMEEEHDKLTVAIQELVDQKDIDPGNSGLESSDPVWAYTIPSLRHAREARAELKKQIIEAASKATRLNQREYETAIKAHFSEVFMMVITRVFDGMELTPQQRNDAPKLVENALKMVESG